jgi:1,4-dihydroxy-2-naphthoate octaprenyltransferase
MKNWLLASRPKTLPAALVPVWCGCVLAWKLQGSWNPWLAFCTLAAALCIQISTNFFNDAIDARKGADTEKRLGPQRVTASGLIPRRMVLIAATIFLGLAGTFGMILFCAVGWPVIWIGIPSLYFAYGYTGGPLPLAYKGLGELFVVIFFGLVAV